MHVLRGRVSGYMGGTHFEENTGFVGQYFGTDFEVTGTEIEVSGCVYRGGKLARITRFLERE